MLNTNNAEISRIKSDYILKSIFSNVDYNRLLKLIKINKSLQKRLGISLENYKNKSDFPFEYLKKTFVFKNEKMYRWEIPGALKYEKYMCYKALLTLICFIIFLIYSILLVFLNTFDNSNTKDNYNQKSLVIIK